ncbi:hypothetical protein AAC387_Pa03g2326 [Persea americana]
MGGNGGARRLIYCRFNVGGRWEMNGRRKKVDPGIQFSEAFARADTRFARANNSLDELVERAVRAARANLSLFGSARADIASARAHPSLEAFARAKMDSLERT